MIPKRIFTVWLSPPGKEIPKLMQRCIESQKIPGYEHSVITFDNCYKGSAYVNECFEAYERTKQTKFLVKASDYLRCWHICDVGGIHLDADMEVLPGKNFDHLLDCRMFTENEVMGCTANAGFGAEAGHPFLKEYLRRVEDNFKGGGDMVFDPGIRAFADLMWMTDKEAQGIKIYPTGVFFPYNHSTGDINVGPETLVYHHYAGTWYEHKGSNKIGTDYEDRTLQELMNK